MSSKIKVASRLDGVGEYYFSKKLREIAVMRFGGKSIINLGIGSPDMAPPDKVTESLSKSARESGSNMYQSYKGIPALRNAFSAWYERYFNVILDSETQVLPLIGSKEGIMHICMAFVQDGSKVLVPNPGYPAYRAATKLAGGIPVEYSLNSDAGWFPDLASLEEEDLENVSLMWINYPHMPTGSKASLSQLQLLVSFCRKHGIILVNDNPYSFILNDKPLSLLENWNEDDHILELNSLSKSHNMAGWRVGVLAGNEELLNHVLRFKSNMDSGMFKPIMMAAIAALEENDSWYDYINSRYLQRRELAWQLLDLIGCHYSKDQSGMFVWAEIPEGWESGEKFADWILDRTGVFITPGFIFGSQGEKYIRISLCSELDVWEQVINQVKENIESKTLTNQI